MAAIPSSADAMRARPRITWPSTRGGKLSAAIFVCTGLLPRAFCEALGMGAGF